MKVKCAECGRVFDLLDETDQEEWTYGHDCDPKLLATGKIVCTPCEGGWATITHTHP